MGKEDTAIKVEGNKWFGKPHSNQCSQRGEGGVGFLVCEFLVSEVEFITSVGYEESVRMKVLDERGRSALSIGCVSTSVAVVESCYGRLKEDVLSFREKGQAVLLCDFNALVGRSVEVNDVIGRFWEDACNASSRQLSSFFESRRLL